MLALNRSEKANLGEDLKRLQYYIEVTQKDGFVDSVVGIFKFIKLFLDSYCRKRATRFAISINKKLNKILGNVYISVVDEEAVKSTKSLLGKIKELKVAYEKLTLNNPELDALISSNIKLAYKIEKEVRQSFYSDKKGEMSDLAKSATSISSQNIGSHLNAN